MLVLPITNPAEILVVEREDLAGYCNEIFEATRRFVTYAERLCGISRLKPSHSSPSMRIFMGYIYPQTKCCQ